MKPKSLVIRVAGTNCDKETVNALSLVGFNTKLTHINEIIDSKIDLLEYNLIVIPGGFSFGDYISAGKVFAIEVIHKLKKELETFIKNKNNFMIGICNGFQVLVKLGLLPKLTFRQQVTLTDNLTGKFECRWIYLKTNKKNPSPLSNLPEIIELPVAHAEGNFYTNKKELKDIIDENLYLFQYCDANGNITRNYPNNPNGSIYSIAGITDKTGRVIGLMPHPERFVILQQHPFWQFFGKNKKPYGTLFFKAIYDYIIEKI
ncbi:MAG: phosphoribosylformylglycinamidine synthase I [Endomicrobia bacterium]|nr:phosphoribosylformylglycinamidine synthase I [Endomicrobiia bacterium]